MKKIIALIVLLALQAISSNIAYGWYGPYHLVVGKQPVGIFQVTNETNYDQMPVILCAGVDANFNGKQDPGDEPPSLWAEGMMLLSIIGNFDGPFYTKKIMDLDFPTTSYFVRPAVDRDNNIMYYPGPSGVQKITFSQNIFTAVKEDFLPVKPVDISLGNTNSGAKRLYLSLRPSLTEPGYVLVYNVDTKTQFDSIPAYLNVQMTCPVDTTGLLIINEGSFGTNNSRLQYIAVGGNLGNLKHKTLLDTVIGDLANHIAYDARTNTAAITLNGSHEVKLINLSTLTFTATIKDNDSLYNGPRESIFSDSGIYTSSYDGIVYLRDLNGNLLNTFDATGKAEGMNLWYEYNNSSNALLSIANPYISHSYKIDSTVTLYTTIKQSDVKENDAVDNLIIYPNPVTDNFIVNFAGIPLESVSSIEIFNNLGEKAGTVSTDEINSPISIKEFGLSTGIYNLRINFGRDVKTIKFIVM